MTHPWLSHYPTDVPHNINPDLYASVGQLLEVSFRQNATRPFAVCMDQWMSYGQLDQLSQTVGAWLQAQGLPAGERVALMLPNIPQFPVVMAGVLRAGYTCVNVNPLYTARELKHQLRDSGATTIFILENFAKTLQEVIQDTPVERVIVTSMGDLLGLLKGFLVTFVVRHIKKMVPAHQLPTQTTSGQSRCILTFKTLCSQAQELKLMPSQTTPESTAFLQYTGGTTGLSKGAVLTHRNIIAATLQADAWFAPAVKRIGNVNQANAIAALPLYHIFALTMCLMTMRWGAHMTLIPNPRDIPGFIKTLAKRPFHIFPAVNTLFNALLHNPQFKSLDFSHLCITQAGGMAASPGTAKAWQETTGSIMIEGWGMSESCAIGTNNPTNSNRFSGTIGLPFPSVILAIKDDLGHTLATGEAGEICIKGPNVMTGYHNQPAETAATFTADGFMRTGDIGIMDEHGFTRLIDRKKDMILVSGFNVFPSELENIISLCPGVMECAAIGVTDEKTGEAIKVFVVKNNPKLTEEEIAQFCRQNLTGYKVPKYIEFRKDLPKSNVGKILRRELRTAK